MKNKVKVSIIVPVYKVEKYLKRSMESLVNQTLDGIEIICVNDGSPDNCLEILKEYQKNYPDKNIVIIDKKNEGVWKARFDGIKVATGKYIGFIDSDDYIKLDYAEKLYDKAEADKADVVVCGFYRMDTDTEHIYSTEMTQYEGKVIDMNKNPEDTLSINGALWNKLYKAEILKKMDTLKNPPRILEDMMFLLLVWIRIQKIVFIKDSLYYYMVRPDSAITTIKKEEINATQNAMLEVKNIYSRNKKGKKMLPVLDAMAFLHFGISLMFRVSADKTCDIKKELKLNREFLDKNFCGWRKCKYLNLTYSISHKFANIKIAIMKKVYVLRMYRVFIKFYTFMIDKMKVDIKW